MVGAEMPMTSDQVIWSEQNRLHVAYNGITATAAGAVGVNPTTLTLTDGSTNVMSVNDTIVVLDPTSGLEAKCIVLATNGAVNGNVVVQCFTPVTTLIAQGFSAAAGALKIFVYGSAYTKGTNLTAASAGTNSAVRQSITPSFTQFSNSPLILRDQFQINGSDMAQIGWVEVATEDGASGFLWYLKAESETRLRFEDYLEMSMVESELNASAAAGAYGNGALPGSEGLFAAIRNRGNVEVGFTAAAGLDDFDAILKNLDTQGAIEENMLFLQRQTSLDFDDMLASISSGS
jgi:hypothetical protein